MYDLKEIPTLRRDILPISLMELNLGFRRLLDQHLDVFRPKRGISAKKDICNDSNRRLGIQCYFNDANGMQKNGPSRPYIHRLSVTLFVQYLWRNVANTAGKRVKLFIR